MICCIMKSYGGPRETMPIGSKKVIVIPSSSTIKQHKGSLKTKSQLLAINRGSLLIMKWKFIKFSSNISRLNTQFKLERSNQNQINNEIDGISRSILDNGMVEELDKPYTHEEVYQAITQLKVMASPGSNGILSLFCQKNGTPYYRFCP